MSGVSPDELDRLLRYLPILVRDRNVSDWERQFCVSMLARSRRGPVTPSGKQLKVLQRIVNDFQTREMRII